eukprot:scaffold188621_cov27-Tisochrysis_lutea.AAC.1
MTHAPIRRLDRRGGVKCKTPVICSSIIGEEARVANLCEVFLERFESNTRRVHPSSSSPAQKPATGSRGVWLSRGDGGHCAAKWSSLPEARAAHGTMATPQSQRPAPPTRGGGGGGGCAR